MTKYISIIAFLLFASTVQAQRFFTKSASISFYSKAPLEDIEAHNAKGLSVWDLATTQFECSVLMKGFEFEKALMQEHFNEDYVESDKFPKAVFKGKLEGFNPALIAKDGTYAVKISGELTLHGQTKPISTTGSIVIRNFVVSATASLTVLLEDYKIKIPSLVADHINRQVKILVDIKAFQPLPSK